jgi:hypothetical protein
MKLLLAAILCGVISDSLALALPGRPLDGTGLPAERRGRVQTAVGSIAGCATDPSGGALPGVTVTAAGARATRQIVTDPKGCYVLPNLEAGDYSVEAKLAGFKTMTRSGVVVRPGETTGIDLSLCLGVLSEHVWVLPRSYEDLVRAAEAVVHVRVTATRLEPDCENSWIHTAQVLRVLKPAAGLTSPSIEFSQFRSGTEPTPYRVGAELIMGISLSRSGKPAERTAGPFGVYYVTGGRVVRARAWGTDRYDDMKLAGFFAALQDLIK